jgi:hypothetical protein
MEGLYFCINDAAFSRFTVRHGYASVEPNEVDAEAGPSEGN